MLAGCLIASAVAAQVSTPGLPHEGLPRVDVHRVNCGGGLFVDLQGNTWDADFGFNTGTVGSTANPIANTDLATLYQSDRQDPAGRPELIYNLPVMRYQPFVIDLHFAETDPAITGPGQRVFDVLVDGNPAISNLDPYLESGGLDTALVRTIEVSSTNPSLDIQLVHVIGDPSIEAIHIRRAQHSMIDEAPRITSVPLEHATENILYTYDLDAIDSNVGFGDTTTFSLEVGPAGTSIDSMTGIVNWTPIGQIGLFEFVVRATDNAGQFDEQTFFVESRIRLNCGAVTDHIGPMGETWTTDCGYNTGGVFSTSAFIFGTLNMTVYRTERNDPPAGLDMVYTLNVPNGTYTVRLHFAEIAPGVMSPGVRVFGVNIEGLPALVDYDIFAEAGGHRTAVQEDILV